MRLRRTSSGADIGGWGGWCQALTLDMMVPINPLNPCIPFHFFFHSAPRFRDPTRLEWPCAGNRDSEGLIMINNSSINKWHRLALINTLARHPLCVVLLFSIRRREFRLLQHKLRRVFRKIGRVAIPRQQPPHLPPQIRPDRFAL